MNARSLILSVNDAPFSDIDAANLKAKAISDDLGILFVVAPYADGYAVVSDEIIKAQPREQPNISPNSITERSFRPSWNSQLGKLFLAIIAFGMILYAVQLKLSAKSPFPAISYDHLALVLAGSGAVLLILSLSFAAYNIYTLSYSIRKIVIEIII